MDQAVRGQERRRVDVERSAIDGGDAPAGLLDQDGAGGDVPGAEAELPVAVEPAARDVGEIDDGGAQAAPKKKSAAKKKSRA